MAMSFKNYTRVAEILNDNLADTNVESRAVACVARELADYFKWDNPRFRYDKFYAACGLDEWGMPPVDQNTPMFEVIKSVDVRSE